MLNQMFYMEFHCTQATDAPRGVNQIVNCANFQTYRSIFLYNTFNVRDLFMGEF